MLLPFRDGFYIADEFLAEAHNPTWRPYDKGTAEKIGVAQYSGW